MTDPHEVAIATARAAEDAHLVDGEVLLGYLREGVDARQVALAACRMLAHADRRLTKMTGRDEGAWLSAIAQRAAREKSGDTL